MERGNDRDAAPGSRAAADPVVRAASGRRVSRGRAAAAAGVLSLLVWSGCAGSPAGSPELLGLEGRDRETLAATYPAGTPRDVVRARESEALVFSINACDFGRMEHDAALRAAVEAFRSEFPRITPACDRVRLARTGWVTVVGGLAYYQDYVFYDALGHVLIAYRTFLQSSGD